MTQLRLHYIELLGGGMADNTISAYPYVVNVFSVERMSRICSKSSFQ